MYRRGYRIGYSRDVDLLVPIWYSHCRSHDVHCEDKPRLVMSRFGIWVVGKCFFPGSLVPFRIPANINVEMVEVATFLSKRGLSMFRTVNVILGPASALITSQCV